MVNFSNLFCLIIRSIQSSNMDLSVSFLCSALLVFKSTFPTDQMCLVRFYLSLVKTGPTRELLSFTTQCMSKKQ